MKKYLLTFLASCAVLAGSAQPVYTLRSCLETGLEQNYSIRIIRNEQAISDNNTTLANAGYLPTLELTAGYDGALNNERTVPREGSVTTEHGIYNQTLSAGLDLGWTVFDGFRIRTNYEKLKELQELGRLNTRITIENFVAALTAEYYNFVQQTIRLNNFRYAVQLSKERLRIVEARYKIGNFSRLDMLQAKVDFNADSSQYMKQQELVFASRIKLNELMAKENVDERFSVLDTIIQVNDRLNWAVLEDQTLRANTSLLTAARNQTIAELDLKTLQARNYPYLNLSAGYGYTRNMYSSGANRNRGTLGLDAGLRLGFTIFDGNRKREQTNARIQIDNARLAQQQLEQELRSDLSNFWQSYLNNLEIIKLEKENLIAAEENYNIALERYKLGDLSGIEMREAQKSLLDAEERILTAEYDTKLCEISLLQISGNILSYLEEQAL